MSTLLLKDADVVITMDPLGTTIRGGGVFICDNIIEQVGPTPELPDAADEVIDARGLALAPGLINTHHHFFQSMFRAVPGAQDCALFGWLDRLLPLYAGVDGEAVRIASLTAMAELVLSGCTTSSDHHYMFLNDATLDVQIEAASEIGMRMHSTRGSMSMGESSGGTISDDLVEAEDAIIADSVRLIERLSRSVSARNAAHRSGAVHSVRRHQGADEGVSRARPVAPQRHSAHTCRRDPRRDRVLQPEIRPAPRPSTWRRWVGSDPTCGGRTPCT